MASPAGLLEAFKGLIYQQLNAVGEQLVNQYATALQEQQRELDALASQLAETRAALVKAELRVPRARRPSESPPPPPEQFAEGLGPSSPDARRRVSLALPSVAGDEAPCESPRGNEGKMPTKMPSGDSVDTGDSQSSEEPEQPRAGGSATGLPASAKGLGAGGRFSFGSPLALGLGRQSTRPPRLLMFADMSTECDDECALLYLLAELNNKDIATTIELVMADSQARFQWMEHLFKEKFAEGGSWKVSAGGASFTAGCVTVNNYLAHCATREEMVIKDLQNKAPSLELHLERTEGSGLTGVWPAGHIGGIDYLKVPKGACDVILVAAPIPAVDPAFFRRFTEVCCTYVVGTPGGVNCPQPSWGGLLHSMQCQAPVVYLTPQFTRAVRFPKAYIEENPHWNQHIKRTVFYMALTCMARRPEIPPGFGDWGLVLRLNAANARLCASWFEDVMVKGMDAPDSCPDHMRHVIDAYVERNSGNDRKPGAVVNELRLLGYTSGAEVDARGAPVSEAAHEVLRKEYREELFKLVYTCIHTTEAVLFRSEQNFKQVVGNGHFRMWEPKCGYQDPLKSLGNIFGAEEAIDILRDLPVKTLTPAYDMVGAICALCFPEPEHLQQIGLDVLPADASMGAGLFPPQLQGDLKHPILMVTEQADEVIDRVVKLLNEQVGNDPWVVIDEFWATWRGQSQGPGSRAIQIREAISFDHFVSISRRSGETVRGDGFMQSLVVHPAHRIRWFWNICSALLILHDFVIVPMQVFDIEESNSITLGTSIFWNVDMLFSFFVGYYDSGTIEMRIHRVAINYLRTWFPLDITVITVDWVAISLRGPDNNSTTRKLVGLLRGLRCLRLLRLAKLQKITESIIEAVSSSSLSFATRILKMVLMIFGLLHLVTCLWYLLGATNESDPRTWLSINEPVRTYGVAYQYLTSLHFTFGLLLLGAMDIFPTNTRERLFSDVLLIVGLIVFSSFVSSITGYMSQIADREAENQEKDSKVRQYFEDHMITIELANQIESFRRHMKRNRKRQRLRRDEIEGLEGIPDTLAIMLSGEIFVPSVTEHPFLQAFLAEDPGGLAYACHRMMEEASTLPGNELFWRGQATTKVYIVVRGCCRYTQGSKAELVGESAWVSEAALWLKWRHRGNFISQSVCSLAVLSIASFRTAVSEHPSMGPFAAKFAEQVARCVPLLETPFVLLSDLWNDTEAHLEIVARLQGEGQGSLVVVQSSSGATREKSKKRLPWKRKELAHAGETVGGSDENT